VISTTIATASLNDYREEHAYNQTVSGRHFVERRKAFFLSGYDFPEVGAISTFTSGVPRKPTGKVQKLNDLGTGFCFNMAAEDSKGRDFISSLKYA
jgi:hypothetical protein